MAFRRVVACVTRAQELKGNLFPDQADNGHRVSLIYGRSSYCSLDSPERSKEDRVMFVSKDAWFTALPVNSVVGDIPAQ